MTDSYPNWLSERMIKGIKGFNLDAYLMALEGWRRGLTLTWYFDLSLVSDMKLVGFNPLAKSFSLTDNSTKQTHFFYRSRGDKVANEAVDIVHQKDRAKESFQKANVATPKGIVVDNATTNEEMIKAINKLNYPLVVKPTIGSLGKGVTTNIQNEKELFQAIENIKIRYEDYTKFIIEEHAIGQEYRVYVVENEVVAVTKKEAVHIVGDGVHSIRQLVELKNNIRKENPYLIRKLIQVNEEIIHFLKKQNRDIEDIPENASVIQLKSNSNISSGGDPVDATDVLESQYKQLAIDAVRAIPNLNHAGVDIIVNEGKSTVLEVNATASIQMHLFPSKGKARNVPADIMNYYYPQSKKNATNNNDFYFNYKEIRRILRKKQAQEITIQDAPTEKFYKTRYIVSGKVQKVGYRNWIRKQAVKHNLNGYTRNLKNGNVVVVVGGIKKEAENFKKICEKGPSKAKVEKVKELKWEHPIELGFEIRK